VTAEQLSAVVDAWVWADEQINTHGPGITLCAIVCIAWSITGRIHRRLKRAAHHIDTILTPADDTQPGSDDDLLIACWDAWKATDTRKEDQS
jgi:hypothetical protein